jgi:4'-phosphopantetheinyl transferase
MATHNHVEILYCDTFSLSSGIAKGEYTALQHAIGLRLVGEIFRKIGVDTVVSDSTVQRDEFGKPFVDGAHFNISHSSHIVIAAGSLHENVGIDIELVRTLEWQEYADVFTESELEMIGRSLSPGYTLLELWVKKESILKADGHGLQIPFVNVILYDGYGIITGKNHKFSLKRIDVENHVCYLSCRAENIDVTVGKFLI